MKLLELFEAFFSHPGCLSSPGYLKLKHAADYVIYYRLNHEFLLTGQLCVKLQPYSAEMPVASTTQHLVCEGGCSVVDQARLLETSVVAVQEEHKEMEMDAAEVAPAHLYSAIVGHLCMLLGQYPF